MSNSFRNIFEFIIITLWRVLLVKVVFWGVLQVSRPQQHHRTYSTALHSEITLILIVKEPEFIEIDGNSNLEIIIFPTQVGHESD